MRIDWPPVVGFAEAGLRVAAAEPDTTLVATNGTLWCEMLGELVQWLGINDKIARIHSLKHLQGDNEAIAKYLSRIDLEIGASRIVLGGAGLIAILPIVAAICEIPVIDPHRVAISQAVEMVKLGDSLLHTKQLSQTTVGLSRALCTLIKSS